MNVLRKEKAQNQKGFTIIEVVLVLAIAGLIFLMVFIALPALQSSQRDTARKGDVSGVASAITTYGSNNRGAFPTTVLLTGDPNGKPATTGKFGGYITTVSSNIDTVTVQTAANPTATVVQGEIVVTQKTQCGTAAAATGAGATKSATETFTTGSTRQFTVVTYLESGGGVVYCQDS
ncbi:MAG: hypothetical protein JWN12_555 [Candidatus Saccharibacteria bacterium]|nr:hypothetical protein [Candidatus Saccharibacteria bacterium]